MKISEEFVLREVAGDYVVVPVGSKSISMNAIIHLNEVGAFIFENLQKQDLTLEELAKKMIEEYAVEYEVAYEDVKEFVAKLQERNIL